jgi:hypothetical protein
VAPVILWCEYRPIPEASLPVSRCLDAIVPVDEIIVPPGWYHCRADAVCEE